MQHYVIAINREFGSGGKEIACHLAEKLGINWYEQDILELASEESGINRAIIQENTEKLDKPYFLQKLLGRPKKEMVSPSAKKFISNQNIFNIQSEVIKELAGSESCIIVGKCADYILRKEKYPNVIRIMITAPFDVCVESVMSKMYVDHKRAEELVKETNKYREDYNQFYSGENWKEPLKYDLMINTGIVPRNEVVDLLEYYVKLRFPWISEK